MLNNIQLTTTNKLSLWILGIGTFAIGTDAFIVAGVMNEMAKHLSVTLGAIGQLITIFSITYALFSPISAWCLSGLDRKRILQIAVMVFIIGNLISSLSTNYWTVVIGRIIAALGAASYTPQAAVAASEIVPEHQKGIALSIVYGGMTLAVALGIPLGTLMGQMLSWRMPFIGIAILGLVSLIGLSKFLPMLGVSIKRDFSNKIYSLLNKAVVITLLITLLAVVSEHAVYSYISVIFENSNFGKFNALSIVLVFFWCWGSDWEFYSGT